MTTLPWERMLTASKARRVIWGDEADRLRLYQELIGEREPEDLSDNYAVQKGLHDEPLNIRWIEKTTKRKIVRRQERIRCIDLPWLGATVDGVFEDDGTPVEFKSLTWSTPAHTIGDTIGFVQRHSPQVLVQMICLSVAHKHGWLAVQQDMGAPALHKITVDETYTALVMRSLAEFWQCVESKTPPSPPPPPPVPPEEWRSYDLDADPSTLPNWAPEMKAHLTTWRETKDAFDKHDSTKKDIKALLPDDVGRVTWRALKINRARNKAVTISERSK